MILPNVRRSLRSLVRQPGFTIPAVLTLALSIGLTTAVFSVLYGIVLRSLPYASPDRLVLVSENDIHNAAPRSGSSLPDFRDWQAQSRSFDALAAFSQQDMTLAGLRGGAERVAAAHVTYNLFPTLGVAPIQGRSLSKNDDVPNAAPVALIGEELWRTRFGADPAIVGRTIDLDSTTYEVIGVMPAGFTFPQRTRIWTALDPFLKEFQRLRGVHSLAVLGRLRPGATVATAQTEMDVIARRLEHAYPADNTGRGIVVEPLHDAVAGRSSPILWVLFGAALLVLLIGCANVAGLMFVRSGQRAKEISIRRALGASRGHVIRQILGESVLITIAGAIGGVALATWGIGGLLALAPDTLPRRSEIALHVPVLIFAIVVAAVACMLAGLVPALTASSERSKVGIRTRAAGVTASRDHRHSRRLLIVAELAVAVVLTVGAALLLRSYATLMRVSVGVSHLDLITANVTFPEGKYPSPSRKEYPHWPQMTHRYDEILESVRRIPGVTAVALALEHPLRPGWTSQTMIVGRPVRPGPQDELRIRPVTAGYAVTVGLPLLQGRDIDIHDRLGSELVVVVNKAMADKYFPAGDAVGHEIEFWGIKRRIVGVVGNERFLGLDRQPEPALYPSLYQLPMNDIYIVLRSQRPLPQVLPMLRSTLASIDADVPMSDIRTLETLISTSVAPQRFTTVLLTIFGMLALLLAAVGVFGLIAYQVSLRRHELGIRSALGAGSGDLLLLIMREAAALSAMAVVIGWLGAVSLTRFLERFLFGVTPLDPAAFVMSGVVLAMVGLAAAAVPAFRASRVEPMRVLRAD